MTARDGFDVALPLVGYPSAIAFTIYAGLESPFVYSDGYTDGYSAGAEIGGADGFSSGMGAAAAFGIGDEARDAARAEGYVSGIATGTGASPPVETNPPTEAVSPAASTTLATQGAAVQIDFTDTSALAFAGVVRVLYADDAVTEIGEEVVYWRNAFAVGYQARGVRTPDYSSSIKLRLSILPDSGLWPTGRLKLRTVAVDAFGNINSP